MRRLISGRSSLVMRFSSSARRFSSFEVFGSRSSLEKSLAQLARVVVALLGIGHHDLAAQLALLAMHRLELLHDLHELLPRRAERESVKRKQKKEKPPHAALILAFGSGYG